MSAPLLPAATVLLLRDRPCLQVLMVRRHHQIDFATGAMVFPGGKISGQDHAEDWAELALGWDEVEPAQRAPRIAAVREAFEESGVLLARRPDGSPWRGETPALEIRAAVDRGELPFADVVRSLDARVDLEALSPTARWMTPEGMPKRFDTWFFLSHAPEDQAAVCDGREAVNAEWIAPAEALRRWDEKRIKMMFPTRLNLMLLAEAGDTEAAIAAAAARPPPTVLPRIDEGMLRIPEAAGYGVTEARLADER